MSSAIFRITVTGGESLAAVLGKARDAASREQSAILAGETRFVRDSGRLADAHVKTWEKAEKERTRAALRAAAEQKKAEETAQRGVERAYRDATREIERNNRDRVRNAQREAQEIEKLAKQKLAVMVAAEEKATQATEREYDKRKRAYERWQNDQFRSQQQNQRRIEASDRAAETSRRAMASQLGRGAYGAVSSFASTMHGQIQDVRERRAVTERVLNQALYQAGAGGENAAPLRARVIQFAQQNNMDSAELAAGINAAQTEFSSLGNSRSTQGERAANLERMLSTAAFARDTGQDVGQVMRVQGMLANTGMSGDTQRQTLLAMTGMAQRGAIELGSVSREAMAPIMRRVAHAREGVDPNDQEGLQHATQQAVLQSMAEMEVGRGLGLTPRRLGNVTAGIEEVLRNPTKQAQMLTNIRGAAGLSAERRTALENQLFARDTHGRSHLRGEYQSTFGLAQGLTQAGLDSTTANTIFGGGGHGNPMALKTNERQILGAFMGEGNENVRKMMAGAGQDFTEADVQRGKGVFSNDAQAKLTGQKEAHDNALSDNTSAMNRLSNSFADWVAAHPVAAAVGTAAGGAALPAIAGAVTSAVASTAGIGAGALLGAPVAPIASRIAADKTRRELLASTNPRIRSIAREQYGDGPAPPTIMENLHQIVNAIKEGFHGAHLEVSPHAAAHATAQASVARP